MVILIGNCNRYQTNHMNILKNIKNSYFYSNTFLKSIIANILLSLPLEIARLFVLTIWKDESSNVNNTTPSKIHFYKNNQSLYFSINFCSQRFHKCFQIPVLLDKSMNVYHLRLCCKSFWFTPYQEFLKLHKFKCL